MTRRDKGEGSLFQLPDGRWCVRINVTLANGEIKRLETRKKDRATAKAQLEEWRDLNKKRLPFSEENWTVETYMLHWLEEIMPGKIRPRTMHRYRDIAYRHIIPNIGRIPLKDLGVRHVQSTVDDLARRGVSPNGTLKFQRVLSACLTWAMREEIIFRNVAQLVELPKYSPKEIIPWTAQQAQFFLRKTKGHRFHIAYKLMLTYGIREGEILGLRWSDIDFSNDIIYIRQQVYWLNCAFHADEVKTDAGRRSLSLIPEIKQELLAIAAQKGIDIPAFDPEGSLTMDNLILATCKNTPISARNLMRSFHNHINQAGLPRITIHTMRHTTATLLKNMNVPVKDVQLILGHADISTTLKIYQHGDEDAKRSALVALGAALS